MRCSHGCLIPHTITAVCCMQGSLSELLDAAKADVPIAESSGDNIDFKGTAITMSMRFHFATTFAKLREWPAEISRVMSASTSTGTSATTLEAPTKSDTVQVCAARALCHAARLSRFGSD